MANYQSIIADIEAKVYENTRQEITGANLNSVLKGMVNSLGAGYQYIGIAEPDTVPSVGDAKVFCIALTEGDYTSFGDFSLTRGEIGVLSYDSEWHFNKAPFLVGVLDRVSTLEDTKADKDGYYEQMSVGVADNLADRGDGVPAEFTRRPTGDHQDVQDGTATIKRIKGNTLVWNQLIDNGTTGITLVNGRKYRVKDTTNRTDTIVNGAGSAITVVGGSDMVQDLTKMFGAGNEPSTVEEFEALFPASYYPYNEGQLLSLKADGIVTDGFNQWDEEYQTGYWNSSGVLVSSSTSEICSKNPIKVFPNTAYYKRTGLNSRLPINRVLFLDNNLNLIRSDYVYNLSLFTTPANCHYIHFNAGTGYGPTYNHDICINLSWSGYRNGEYEPYWKNEKALPALTAFDGLLKSVGDTYDEITRTKDIKRIGSRAYQSGDEDNPNVVTDKTLTFYVLDNPVETTYEEPRNLTYKVADFGTETVTPEGVDEQGVPKTAPFRADIAYGLNAVDTLRNLPKNFISKESMESILNAMVSAGLIASYTLTWDDNNNKYNCTITPIA